LRFRFLLLTFFSFYLLTGCNKKPTPPVLPPVTYLPLNPGNWWEYVYYDTVSQDSIFLREEIGDTITLFGFNGYSYKSDFLPYDFIHIKSDTVILSDTSSYNQRRILFLNKAGAKGDWDLYSVLTPYDKYEVRAHQDERSFEVELENGQEYDDCIKVLTKAHFQSGDTEEMGYYFFASDVGMVKFIMRPVLDHPLIPFELYKYNVK